MFLGHLTNNSRNLDSTSYSFHTLLALQTTSGVTRPKWRVIAPRRSRDGEAGSSPVDGSILGDEPTQPALDLPSENASVWDGRTTSHRWPRGHRPCRSSEDSGSKPRA